MTKLDQLAELGQSIWLDYIRRSFVESGEFKALVEQGLRGFTSNPSIFKQAIAGSDDYDGDLTRLAEAGKSTREIYEALVFEDIQRACDQLAPVFERTGGLDGYGSLEASPDLAEDTQATIEEVQHFFKAVGRPNVMIKIPATAAGVPAIQACIGRGINVNVTLLFSIARYEAVAEAYLAGLEELIAREGDPANVASVASFFVSRIDSKLDPRIESVGEMGLRGKIGIANAKAAYEHFTHIFSGPRWEALAARGARVQRVLWGSTSTKNPEYPDTLYVDNLIGPDTVNTIPPETLQAWLEHGALERTVDARLEEAHDQLERLAAADIDLDRATDELLEEGVDKFAGAFEALLASIEAKRAKLQEGWEAHAEAAGGYRKK